jgi:hypothetical protein
MHPISVVDGDRRSLRRADSSPDWSPTRASRATRSSGTRDARDGAPTSTGRSPSDLAVRAHLVAPGARGARPCQCSSSSRSAFPSAAASAAERPNAAAMLHARPTASTSLGLTNARARRDRVGSLGSDCRVPRPRGQRGRRGARRARRDASEHEIPSLHRGARPSRRLACPTGKGLRRVRPPRRESPQRRRAEPGAGRLLAPPDSPLRRLLQRPRPRRAARSPRRSRDDLEDLAALAERPVARFSARARRSSSSATTRSTPRRWPRPRPIGSSFPPSP